MGIFASKNLKIRPTTVRNILVLGRIQVWSMNPWSRDTQNFIFEGHVFPIFQYH